MDRPLRPAAPSPAPGEPAPSAPASARPAIPFAILRPAIVYAILFGEQGAYLPYIALYLSSAGLDLGTVGALIALYAAVSLVAAPAWGALADSFGDIRGPVLVASLLSGAGIAFLAVASGPWTMALAIALLAAAFAGIIPMIDSRAVRMVGHRDRFGQARAPGSGAFVVIAFATGAVIGRTGPGGMFLLCGPLVLLVGLSAWVLLRLPATERGPTGDPRRRTGIAGLGGQSRAGLSPATILGVLGTPRLGAFFIASIIVWTAHGVLQGFISLRIRDLGADATVVAATWSLGALVEVPLMYAFPALARRFGAERLIVVGGFAFAVRALISGLANEPGLIVEAALYVGTVTWVSGSVDRRVQATAQGIFTGTANGIGAIGGAILGGAIGGIVGLPELFVIAAAAYATGAVIAWVGIGRRGTRRAATRPSI